MALTHLERPTILNKKLDHLGLSFPAVSIVTRDGAQEISAWPGAPQVAHLCALAKLKESGAHGMNGMTAWDDRIPKAYFRGRPSNPVRWRLAEIADANPDIFNVGVTRALDKQNPLNPGAKAYVGSARNFENVNDTTEGPKHKYVIYAVGSTAAFRMAHLLASGSVVLKIEGHCERACTNSSDCSAKGLPVESISKAGACQNGHWNEWFYSLGLEPNVHYVPIKPDLSDLVQTLRHLRENPSVARQIASNGLKYYNEMLQPRNLIGFLASSLQRVAQAEERVFANLTSAEKLDQFRQRGFHELPERTTGNATYPFEIDGLPQSPDWQYWERDREKHQRCWFRQCFKEHFGGHDGVENLLGGPDDSFCEPTDWTKVARWNLVVGR